MCDNNQTGHWKSLSDGHSSTVFSIPADDNVRHSERLISQKTLPTLASAWLPALLPTLDKIVEQRSGAPVDVAFWNSFFKRGATKGSRAFSFISGRVNVFSQSL